MSMTKVWEMIFVQKEHLFFKNKLCIFFSGNKQTSDMAWQRK